MSQQLHLFSSEPFSPELQEAPANGAVASSMSTDRLSSNSLLIAQTRQLFGHDGSNAELIERIKTVVTALNERCREPNLK